MFPVRLHAITALGAIDRRRVEENFFFWADRLNNIEDYMIARKTVTRDRMVIDAVEDMWWNRKQHESTSPLDLTQNPLIGDSTTTIHSGESSEMVLRWNCNLRPVTGASANYFVRVVPFAAGQILWGGADILQNEWPLTLNSAKWERNITGGTAIDDDGAHSVNGQAYFSAPTGRFDVGLIAAPESDSWKWSEAEYEATSVQMTVRRPY